jgi:hypothetical protein
LHAVAAYVRYGSAVASYPGEFFENPLLVGLYGLLFSAGKSVFLFSPPLILGCVGLRRFMRTPQGREDGVLFLLLFGAQLAIAAKWWDWSGDDAWGPRFMIPAAVLLTIPIVELLDARRLVAAFALAGTAVQLLAVLVPGLDYVLVVHQHDMRRKALYVEGRNRVDFEDVRYNPRYSQINGHWQMLKARVGFRAGRDSDADAGREERVGTDLTDTLPPEFWQAQRGFDLFWWRLLTGEVTLNRDRGASEGPRRGPPY